MRSVFEEIMAADLSPSALKVALVILNAPGELDSGGVRRAAQHKAGVSRASAYQGFDQLEKRGLLVKFPGGFLYIKGQHPTKRPQPQHHRDDKEKPARNLSENSDFAQGGNLKRPKNQPPPQATPPEKSENSDLPLKKSRPVSEYSEKSEFLDVPIPRTQTETEPIAQQNSEKSEFSDSRGGVGGAVNEGKAIKASSSRKGGVLGGENKQIRELRQHGNQKSQNDDDEEIFKLFLLSKKIEAASDQQFYDAIRVSGSVNKAAGYLDRAIKAHKGWGQKVSGLGALFSIVKNPASYSAFEKPDEIEEIGKAALFGIRAEVARRKKTERALRAYSDQSENIQAERRAERERKLILETMRRRDRIAMLKKELNGGIDKNKAMEIALRSYDQRHADVIRIWWEAGQPERWKHGLEVERVLRELVTVKT